MPSPLWIVADDLTGAADSGVAFTGHGPVRLDLRPGAVGAERVRVLDLDTREADADSAARAVRTALAGIGRDDALFKKVDSLLRGQIAAELAAVRAAFPHRPLILAPAVPALGRTTVDGRVHIGPNPGPCVADALGGVSGIQVRDARTDADLDAIVAAGGRLDRAPIWVGAAGLAGALARSLAPPRRPRVRAPHANRVLIVAGSHSEPGIDQVASVAAAGYTWVGLPAADLLATDPAGRELLGRRLGVLARSGTLLISLTGAVDHDRRAAMALALGQVCARAVRASHSLVLSGGATARAVLTAVGASSLRLLGELEPGVVLTTLDPPTTSGPRDDAGSSAVHVITKSGSFGDRDTLVRLIDTITGAEGAA